MFTSPEDPFAALPRLRSRESRSQGLLKGYYRMAGNQVRIDFIQFFIAPSLERTDLSAHYGVRPVCWMPAGSY